MLDTDWLRAVFEFNSWKWCVWFWNANIRNSYAKASFNINIFSFDFYFPVERYRIDSLDDAHFCVFDDWSGLSIGSKMVE